MDDLEKLVAEFRRVKALGEVKSLRKGCTGIGYTFETLINKEEDKLSKPDFGQVEIKTKLGYTKEPITLFNASPKREEASAVIYIANRYGYETKYKNNVARKFCKDVYGNPTFEKNKYNYKLKIDYIGQKVIMLSFFDNKFIEKVCEWTFDELRKKLYDKLPYLAIIYGYPYKREDGIYYKYLKMSAYKLKKFDNFLDLIEENKIYFSFYMIYSEDGENVYFDNHGVSIRIKLDAVDELFEHISNYY